MFWENPHNPHGYKDRQMTKKNKIMHLPQATQNAYVKTVLGQHPKKFPDDFVETLIEEKRKKLLKEKHVVQKK